MYALDNSPGPKCPACVRLPEHDVTAEVVLGQGPLPTELQPNRIDSIRNAGCTLRWVRN